MSTRKFSTRVDSMPALPVIEGVEVRHCPGCDGYAVGDDGSVWSCRRRFGCGYRSIWSLLVAMKGTNGHYYVMFRINKKQKRRSVHSLVLDAFVGPCPDGMECRHFPDRDTANNRRSNLQWGTKKENAADKIVHGTDGRGARNAMAVLDDDSARSVYTEYQVKTGAELTSIFNVTPGAMRAICKGSTWKHLGLAPLPRKRNGLPGDRNPSAKITADDVLEIRRRYRAGEFQKCIAKDFGLTQGMVSQITRRSAWRHI